MKRISTYSPKIQNEYMLNTRWVHYMDKAAGDEPVVLFPSVMAGG